MKTFHCTHCQNLVFFENVRCLVCGHSLAFLPDKGLMAALEQAPDGLWKPEGSGLQQASYRLCANYDRENVCNWAVPADDPEALCTSCRLSRVIPDLSSPTNRTAWFRLELAKRRMMYSLLALRLPTLKKVEAQDSGLAFEFLADSTGGDARRVLTGHDNGLITVNIAEADDVHREQQRTKHGEPYRTLLGHFRHEIGHYYWDRLIANGPRLEACRALFGDERADYAASLKKHYEEGPPPNWELNFISAYATTHPWEDWAESWAHFLHMTDALETAGTMGLTLKPKRADEPAMTPPADPLNPANHDFDRMIEAWLPLTYVLNNLNRGLGLLDGYPFVLSEPVIEKLRFIHETIRAPVAIDTLPHQAEP
ncbi:MAG: putative zinc-binding metallopeptidase [Gammaproteobacteria bacterium]